MRRHRGDRIRHTAEVLRDFRNGLLPIRLPDPDWQLVRAHAATGAPVTIDLAAQTVGLGETPAIGFEITPERRAALLEGRDETGTILAADGPAIEAYEARRRRTHPWLFAT